MRSQNLTEPLCEPSLPTIYKLFSMKSIDFKEQLNKLTGMSRDFKDIKHNITENKNATVQKFYKYACLGLIFEIGEVLQTIDNAVAWFRFKSINNFIVIDSPKKLTQPPFKKYFYFRGNKKPNYRNIRYNYFMSAERVMFIFRNNNCLDAKCFPVIVTYPIKNFSYDIWHAIRWKEQLCTAFVEKYLEITDAQKNNDYGIHYFHEDGESQEQNYKEYKYPNDEMKNYFVFKYQRYDQNTWRWYIYYYKIENHDLIAEIEITSVTVFSPVLYNMFNALDHTDNYNVYFEQNYELIIQHCYDLLREYFAFRIMKNMKYDEKLDPKIYKLMSSRNTIKACDITTELARYSKNILTFEGHMPALDNYVRNFDRELLGQVVEIQNLTNDVKRVKISAKAKEESNSNSNNSTEKQVKTDDKSISDDTSICSEKNLNQMDVDYIPLYHALNVYNDLQKFEDNEAYEYAFKFIILKLYAAIANNVPLIESLSYMVKNKSYNLYLMDTKPSENELERYKVNHDIIILQQGCDDTCEYQIICWNGYKEFKIQQLTDVEISTQLKMFQPNIEIIDKKLKDLVHDHVESIGGHTYDMQHTFFEKTGINWKFKHYRHGDYSDGVKIGSILMFIMEDIRSCIATENSEAMPLEALKSPCSQGPDVAFYQLPKESQMVNRQETFDNHACNTTYTN